MQENMNTNESATSSVETDTVKNSEVYFFTTSTLKLMLMSICTFGIYELYWFYKNWVLISQPLKTTQQIDL